LIVSSTASFYGSSPFLLQNIAFINNGTTTFLGTGAMELSQNSIIYNTPTGQFNVASPLVASQNDQAGGFASEIQNYGVFLFATKVASTLALNFRNKDNGSLVVNGQLAITAGFFTQEGVGAVLTLASAGVLRLQNTGLVLSGTVQGITYTKMQESKPWGIRLILF
jgi:hypothetical protein